MSKKTEISIEKTVYKETDKAAVQRALQDIADLFTVNELSAIAKKLKSPIVQLQIRSML